MRLVVRASSRDAAFETFGSGFRMSRYIFATSAGTIVASFLK